jgi:predicted ATPase
MASRDRGGFVRSVRIVRDEACDGDRYPFSIPAIRALDELELHPKVTFLVGENGSGKSTLIEAIAVVCGFNAEGGTKNFAFATRRSESQLHRHLRIARNARRARDGFFLRAESYFNVATDIERLDAEPLGGARVIDSYGGVSLHEQSHGESFLALVTNRFGGDGLYILDEPESALSPQRQLSLLARMHQLVEQGRSQFIVATHSPILMAYPDATIYQLGANGVSPIDYEDTEHFQVTRDFLNGRERYLKHLFATPED